MLIGRTSFGLRFELQYKGRNRSRPADRSRERTVPFYENFLFGLGSVSRHCGLPESTSVSDMRLLAAVLVLCAVFCAESTEIGMYVVSRSFELL